MDAAPVTVVIPVWDDYVAYLDAAVGSVRQAEPDASIVVVDNASATPVTPPAGTSLVRANHRLSVGAARNLGLDQVATEYVTVLDADDQLLPGALPFLRSRLDADPSISVSATSIVDGRTGRRHRVPRRPAAWLARWRRTFALLDCVWSLVPI